MQTTKPNKTKLNPVYWPLTTYGKQTDRIYFNKTTKTTHA